MTPRAVGLTHTSWINAWSLRRACAAAGIDLRTTDASDGMAIPPAAPDDVVDWEFFTEEASLARALGGGARGRFWPQAFPAALLDDKWAFAQWLSEDRTGPQGLAQWPLAAAARAPLPLLLKARHSWVGARRLPRGWLCRDRAALDAALRALPAQGLAADWFFLQEWLGDAPMRLLSVGGFFDAADESRNAALVTERVADYGHDGPSSSAMLVTVGGQRHLVDAAARVLRRLAFRGPYEMEFVVVGERVLVLELNPRWWMQHGLFLALDNGLVKRYIGRGDAVAIDADADARLLWVDGVWLLRRLLRFDAGALRSVWRHARGRTVVTCPTLGAAAAGAVRRVLRGRTQ
jgi:hypothetical protein